LNAADEAAIWRAIDGIKERLGRIELNPKFSDEFLSDDFAKAAAHAKAFDVWWPEHQKREAEIRAKYI
jgi:hypothetical protein